MPRFIILASVLFFAFVLLPRLSVGAEDNPVVASVNGVKIYRSDISQARLRLPERFSEAPLEAVYGLLVNSLIDSKLVAAEARKINLHNDEVVRQQMARIEEQLLERAFMTAYIDKRITAEALQEQYRKMVKQVAVMEEVKARHILLETEAQAREVIRELQGGADFAELAKTRSKGPSGASGGDLGYFAKGQMVPAFSDSAFAMQAGDTSPEPVQTQFGWHVIRVDDRRTIQPPKIEQAEQELRMALSREIGASFLQQLRQTASVKRFNLDGSPMTDEAAER